jgi:hypothetical protein
VRVFGVFSRQPFPVSAVRRALGEIDRASTILPIQGAAQSAWLLR